MNTIRECEFRPLTSNQTINTDHIGSYDLLVCFISLALSLSVFYLGKVYFLSDLNSSNALPRIGIVAVVSVFGLGLRSEEVAYPARIVYRTITITTATYLLLNTPTLPTSIQTTTAELLKLIPIIGSIGALLSWKRPSFSLISLVCLICEKRLMMEMYQIPLSTTDYLTVIETSFFLIIGILTARLTEFIGSKLTNKERKNNLAISSNFFFLIIIGIHLSNYFYSGVAKVFLQDAGSLDWIFENRTDYLITNASYLGFVPFQDTNILAKAIVATGGTYYPIINGMVLASQLGCIFAIARRSWLIASILFFDLMHIVIFLTTGIFFWKWIILNTTLTVGLSRFPWHKVPVSFAAAGMVLIIDKDIFETAHLGWFDTRSVNEIRIIAVTENGEEFQVPSNYFLSYSITVAQMDFVSGFSDTLDTGTWGAVMSKTRLLQGNTCEVPMTRQASASLKHIEGFLQAHHRFILENADTGGRVRYNSFPHHIWSTINRFRPFYQLDKRRIQAYRLDLRSICIRAPNDIEILKTQSITVPVQSF